MRLSVLILCGILGGVISWAVYQHASGPSGPTTCSGAPATVHVFSKDALREASRSRLLLVVLGEVYDVSAGADFYKEGSYAVFIGQDSSRAFQDGNFNRTVEDVRDLSVMDILSVEQWRGFYRKSPKYPFVGYVEGLYYDCNGKATDALQEVDAMVAEGRRIEASEDALSQRHTGCNSQYTAESALTTVSCPATKNGLPQYPRVFIWTHEGTKKEATRCACFGLNQQLERGRTELYPDCPDTSPSCTFKL